MSEAAELDVACERAARACDACPDRVHACVGNCVPLMLAHWVFWSFALMILILSSEFVVLCGFVEFMFLLLARLVLAGCAWSLRLEFSLQRAIDRPAEPAQSRVVLDPEAQAPRDNELAAGAYACSACARAVGAWFVFIGKRLARGAFLYDGPFAAARQRLLPWLALSDAAALAATACTVMWVRPDVPASGRWQAAVVLLLVTCADAVMVMWMVEDAPC
jgi:hypothetical protein